MRVGFPGGPRLEWYDRNPVSRNLAWNAASVAPHTSTQRFTYTIPAGKKAFVEAWCGLIYRGSPAGSVGYVWLELIAHVVRVTNMMWDNNQGAVSRQELYLGQLMQAGETISAYTWDTSTGGLCGYECGVGVVEFDD